MFTPITRVTFSGEKLRDVLEPTPLGIWIWKPSPLETEVNDVALDEDVTVAFGLKRSAPFVARSCPEVPLPQ